MKKIFVAAIFFWFAVISTFAAQTELKLPPYKKIKLENGITLLLMEKHDVPFVSFSTVIKAGAVADPRNKPGIAAFTAEMLHKGTKNRTGKQIAEQLDFVGGTLDFN